MNQVVLDRQSVIPLYYQIQQALLEQIRTGALKVGQPVPSEQEIAERTGVSRMTARQALKSLCHLGVAYSQRGKGTFVARAKLEKDFRQVLSFSEEIRERGSRPRSRVLAFKLITPASEIAEALGLAAKEQVFFLKRVRLADSVPLCIESTHIPTRLCPELKTKFDPHDSLYEALFSFYGIQFDAADEVAEAAIASSEEAKLLRIRKGAPVFHFTRTAYLPGGDPAEFVSSTYRGDRCKVVSRLTRAHGSGVERKTLR